MIKATVICGGSAVRRYDETGKIPTGKWLDGHGGIVNVKTFKTQGEYDAYSMGLADADGWEETMLTNKEFTTRNDKSTDCVYCKEWRAIFSDRENDVFCPDCGKLIIYHERGNEESNNNG